MKEQEALEAARSLAASYDVRLGRHRFSLPAIGGPNSSHWTMLFSIEGGPPGWDWLLNVNDRGENVMVAAAGITPLKPRPWIRFSLRTIFVLVTLLCVVCAPLGWLAREIYWSRARDQFGSRHSVSYVSGTFSRPLGCNSAHDVILKFDSPRSEADRARQLFPEVRYVGQFTSEQAYLDAKNVVSYDATKIVWYGAAPHWARGK